MDKAEFSAAVHEYVTRCADAENSGEELPQVTPYIADCLMKIAKGLTHTPKFIRRTYKDDLIMDAVEDCLKRIRNYNINALTRSGDPNAFAYFTQISYFSFLRTVQKYNKELKKKLRVMERSAIDVALDPSAADAHEVLKYLDEVRGPWEQESGVNYVPPEKKPKKLEKFMEKPKSV